jgi:hypothetical protein
MIEFCDVHNFSSQGNYLPFAEQALRDRARQLIQAFDGTFGKVLADLIGKGQSEPAVFGTSSTFNHTPV